MWGEPRKGTKAYRVQKEVERLQKIAKGKGLDKLLSEAYHDSIFAYSSWIKDKRNKKYVHPKVSKAKELDIKKDDKNIKAVEFLMGDNLYRVEEYSHLGFMSDEHYVDLTLYLNDKKVFAITETESSNEWTTTYNPISIDVYVNEDWVNDFTLIREHRKATDKQVEIDYAESPERIKELKKDFGISELSNENRNITRMPIIKERWFWIVVVGIILWLLFLS